MSVPPSRVRRTVAAAILLTLGVLTRPATPAPAAVVAHGPAAQRVVVSLRGPGPLAAARGAAGPTRVVRALHTAAETAQQGLLDRLDRLGASGEVSGVIPLWATNEISLRATDRVVAELAARPDVVAVRPDRITLVPAYGSPEPNQALVAAPTAWDLGVDGRGVVVAGLDSGVDVSHPDLGPRWRGGTNSWFDPYGEHPLTPTDMTGHGTGALGVAVGGDAGGTTVGTAPGATWIAARVFDDRGATTLTAVHQAFQWALDPDGDPTTHDAPDVVTGSWSLGGVPGCDLSLQADLQALVAAGVAPVFPAGNFGPASDSSVSPGNYPEALGVGAVWPDGRVLSASGRGPSACGGRTGVFPDLVAPGTGISTTDRYGLYQVATGTSLAAPHVAGALALLLEARPDLTPAQQRAALLTGAHDLGATGPDDETGYGLLDVAAALEALPPPPSPDRVELSTTRAAVVPGVSGRPDDADLYSWDGSGFARTLDLSAAPYRLPAGADVDGFDRLDDASFYVSLRDPVRVPGLGRVEDEDVLLYDDAGWRIAFDGSAHGLRDPREDLDGLTVSGSTICFSTVGNVAPPRVPGRADDADLYCWTDGSFTRVWDATDHGLPAVADVDGVQLGADSSQVAISLAADGVLPGLGGVQDEDIVVLRDETWSVLFDGTARGLTGDGLDVDAFDLP